MTIFLARIAVTERTVFELARRLRAAELDATAGKLEHASAVERESSRSRTTTGTPSSALWRTGARQRSVTSARRFSNSTSGAGRRVSDRANIRAWAEHLRSASTTPATTSVDANPTAGVAESSSAGSSNGGSLPAGSASTTSTRRSGA